MSLAVVQADGTLRFGLRTMRVAWGRGGITRHKQEGDGATPAGTLALRRVLYRADRIARPRAGLLPVEPIAADDGWCDAPGDARYNQPVRLPYVASHEEMWRADHLYDLVGVLGWNDRPAVRGLGSAIFLHVASPDYAPTEGCLALALPDLQAVLAAGLSGVHIG